jgi:hypothetical protein
VESAVDEAVVQVGVRADRVIGRLHRPWVMIGAERLSQLSRTDTAGQPIGVELEEALGALSTCFGLGIRRRASGWPRSPIVLLSGGGSQAGHGVPGGEAGRHLLPVGTGGEPVAAGPEVR